ncbi:MAG: hypothetical protein IJR82_00030 [Bacilli bacterium]|nr:hypothetical protein [Bacilli bacterium]
MHDKINDEETKNKVAEDINEFFDLSSLNIDDLSKTISECNLDNLKED